MAGFNLTAQINLQGPGNVKKVVAGIQKQLNGLKADVNLNINPATIKTLGNANKKLQAINASLNKVSSSAARANGAVGQFASTINSIGKGNVSVKIQAASKATQQLGKTAGLTFKNLKIARTEIEEFGRQSALAIRRFTAFASVTSVIYGVNNAINQALTDFVKFDRQLVRIAQVSGQTVNNLKGLQGTISQLATGIGVSSSSLAEISVTLTQAGFSIREVQKALKALALTDVAPTFNNLSDTVEGSIALLKQFSIGAGQLEASLGSINAVAARFAVESSDIIAAIQRAGGVFAAASRGVSEGTDALNQFIAVFTSVRATTREGAETIATGLRTIFTRLQRESSIDALKEFGVNLQDAEGKFVGAFKAVELLSKGLGGLDPRDIRFSKIVEELGGFRQIGKVIPLIGQFATAQEALKVAQQGQGSLAESNAKAQQALAIQFARVREEFLQLVRNIAGTDSFKGLISGALSLASALIKVADSVKGMIPILGLLGAARGASAIGQFAKGFGGGLSRTQGFARGGTVPGSGNTDSVPAMLTPGEFVLRKSSVRAIGTQKLHSMNKYGNGGKEDGKRLLKAEPGTAFTHLTASRKSNFSYTAKSGKKKNISRLYDSFGLDLPANWNSDWNLTENDIGVTAAALRTYIQKHDVFKTLKGKTNASKLYGLEGGQSGAAGQALNKKYPSIKRKIMAGLPTGSAFFDIDKNVIDVLRPIVSQALGSSTLRKSMKQKSVGLDGRKRIRLPREQRRATGGSIQDTVPAMLTPGEFVMNAKSAKSVGYGNLRKMNTRPQGFNKGGVVGFNTGGLAGVRGGDVRLNSGLTSQLASLEQAFAGLGLPVDKLTSAVNNNGRVSRKTYVEAVKQSKANIKLAQSSAKTSTEIKKVALLEQQLTGVRSKVATQKAGGMGARLASFGEGPGLTNMIFAAGGAAVALESFDTALTSALASGITSLATFTTTIFAAIPAIQALATSAVGKGIGNVLGRIPAIGGIAKGLAAFAGPLALLTGAVGLAYAGFAMYNAYQKKAIELAKKAAQNNLDSATKSAADAMKKFSQDASNINFQEVNKAIADQLAAGEEFGAARNRQTRFESQSTTGNLGFGRELAAWLTLSYVDSIEDATANNEGKVKAAAKELVDANSEALKNAQGVVFEQFAKGATLSDLKTAAPGTEEAKALDNLVDAALAADQTYQEQVSLAAQQGRELNNTQIQANKARVRAELLSANGMIALKDKTEQAARAQERLNRLQVKLATSFERLDVGMQQSIARIKEEAEARQMSIDSSIARARGEASITEIRSRAANVVDNPSAFTSEERNATRGRLARNLAPSLGRQQANEVSALATFDPALIEKGFTDVANNIAVGAKPSVVGAEIRKGIAENVAELRRAGAGDVADNLQQQANEAATAVATKLQGVNDPNKRRTIIDESLKDLRKSFDEARSKAVNLAKTFSETRAAALNQFAKNVQEAAKLQNEALKYEQAATDARRNASDSIKEALTDFGPDVQELLARGAEDMTALSGKADPGDIADNFKRLNAEASELETQLRNNTDRAAEQADLVSRLAEVNRELNNNKAALEKLAESATKAADAALAEVNERKKLQDANKKFAETLLTSGPDELKAMDEALVRANQRVNGFIPQAGANQRKRFFELLKQTGSVRQASQGVAAETRGQDLKFLQDTRDVRIKRMIDGGLSREAATDRANRDESAIFGQMGREAGLGALGQSIVRDAARDTGDREADPIMQKLVTQYEQAADVQAKANEHLADIASGAANQALVDSQSNLQSSIQDLDATMAGYDRRTRPEGKPADGQAPSRRTQFRAAGGSIFRPQGTDTVPAMLTPGEFVVNRKAAQKNMGLLQSINGGKVTGYSNGGKVLYLRGGGFAQRDTNKDGVITIGTEDGSGLNDSNNDGVITFAEFMANQSLTNPKAKDYINKMSNNMARYNKNISPLNVLKNEQFYDNLELFGPINSELADYIEDGFKGDLEAFNAAKNENKKINEEIKKLNNGKDIDGNKIPFNDNPKLKRINELLAKREKNRGVLGDIGGNRNFALARDRDFRDGVTISEVIKKRDKDIAQAINQGMNPKEAAAKVDADYIKAFGFTPQQAGLYQNMVDRDQTIKAVQGGGGGITAVKAGHRRGASAARSQYFKDRQALINQGMNPTLASQQAMKDYPQNYMDARDQYWEDRAEKIKEKQGVQPEKPMGPVNPIMGALAIQNKDVQAEQQNAARLGMKIESDLTKKEAAKTKAKNDKAIADQKAKDREAAQIKRQEKQAANKRIREAEAADRRRAENASIKANVDKQQKILDDKIASKEAEIRSNQQLHDQEGWFDWTYNQVIGDDTRNYELKRKILDQELSNLQMAREGTQKIIDSGYDRKVLDENYGYAAGKSGHKFDYKSGDTQTQRTMTGTERAGVYTQAENQQMYDSTMQGIQATKRTVEAVIQAVGTMATVGASSLFSGTGAASTNLLSKVPVLGQMLTRGTLGSSMASGALTSGATSVVEEAAGVSESKSLTESVGNVVLDTIIGGLASGVGHIAADMFGGIRKATKVAKPKPGVDGEGLMTGTKIDKNAPLPDTLDPLELQAQNAPNNFDPSTVKSDLNAGPINPNYRTKPGDPGYEKPTTISYKNKAGQQATAPLDDLTPEQINLNKKTDAILSGNKPSGSPSAANTGTTKVDVGGGPAAANTGTTRVDVGSNMTKEGKLIAYSYEKHAKNTLNTVAVGAGVGGEEVVQGAIAASPLLTGLEMARSSLAKSSAPLTSQEEFKPLVEAIKGRVPSVKFRSRGGPIYANNGALIPFQSRGTDTVPAMLTPGEFVVNRNSTSKFLPVLRAINSGYSSHNEMVNHLAKGGVAGRPQYLQNGGLAGGATNNGVSVNSQIQGLEEFKTMVAQLNQAISGGTENMNSVVTQITQASNSFSATAQSVNEAATNIPDSVAVAQNVRVDGIPDTLSGFSDSLLNSSVAQSNQDTAQKFNDLNTKNEGSLGLQSPNNNQFIT